MVFRYAQVGMCIGCKFCACRARLNFARNIA
nr:MAG TPA: 4Fe-4S dicluster domain protein [Caudoviricetes sp.]